MIAEAGAQTPRNRFAVLTLASSHSPFPSIHRRKLSMLSALLMIRRLVAALRVALREEDFGRILSAGLALIIVGAVAYSLGGDWSIVDGLYVAVATLTTSSVLDPELTITDPWRKVFTAGYVLVGIGILVEVARRLGMGFIAARAEVKEAKAAAKPPARRTPE